MPGKLPPDHRLPSEPPASVLGIEETGDSKYRDIAENTSIPLLANVIREDGSTWHTFSST